MTDPFVSQRKNAHWLFDDDDDDIIDLETMKVNFKLTPEQQAHINKVNESCRRPNPLDPNDRKGECYDQLAMNFIDPIGYDDIPEYITVPSEMMATVSIGCI